MSGIQMEGAEGAESAAVKRDGHTLLAPIRKATEPRSKGLPLFQWETGTAGIPAWIWVQNLSNREPCGSEGHPLAHDPQCFPPPPEEGHDN